MMDSPFRNRSEFEEAIKQIDDEMRDEQVAFRQRGMEGWRRLSSRYGLGLSMPGQRQKRSKDDVSVAALTDHIFDWFKARYGAKENMVWAPSIGIVNINGDLFKVNVPKLFGQVHFELNAARLHDVYESVGKSRPVMANGLQKIEDMTKAYADSLRPEDLSSIASQLGLLFFVYNEYYARHGDRLVTEAAVDLDAGVIALMNGVSFGHARWCFHQAAEKVVKAVLRLRGIDYDRRGHKLDELTEKAGLKAALASDVADVHCFSDVRYGEVESTCDEALRGYGAALAISNVVLPKLPGKRLMTDIAVFPGPFPTHYSAQG